jgi:integrase
VARHLIKGDLEIRNVKRGTDVLRLSDGDGLFLQLFVNGGSHGWRLAYSHQGRRNILSLGTYPDTGLALARRKADELRQQLAEGIDPSAQRREARAVTANDRSARQRASAGLPPLGSFEAVARDWYAKNSGAWAASHAEKILARLERDVFPWIGSRGISGIKPREVLALLRRVEARGAIETTHRVQQNCSQVFRFAVATGLAESDPSRDLRGALTPWKPQHYPTITESREVGVLLRAISGYQGSYPTRCALQLAPLLFVRPGELRQAEWSEINFAAAEWRIPASKMKGRTLHIVPLSRQALAIVRDLHKVTGSDRWLFPSVRADGHSMSENTLNAALRGLGYERKRMTAHGFRGMASTILHELGWPSDVIERQLAHGERNEVKAAYNHAEHLPKRRKMMQAWADHLDKLRTGVLS